MSVERIIVTFVASIIKDQYACGINDPLLIARKVEEELDRKEFINRYKVLAEQIRAYPSRDLKEVQRKFQSVGRTFIYKAWAG